MEDVAYLPSDMGHCYLSEEDKRWIRLAVFLLGSCSSESQSAFHPPQSTSTIAPAAAGEGAFGKRAQFTQLNTKNLLLASQRELWIAWLFHRREQNMHTVSNSIQATPSWEYLIRTQKLSVTSAYCNYLVAEHTTVITPNTPNSSQNFQLCSLLVLIAFISVRKKSKCFYWMLHSLHIKMAQKRIMQVSQCLAFHRCLCSMCILLLLKSLSTWCHLQVYSAAPIYKAGFFCKISTWFL